MPYFIILRLLILSTAFILLVFIKNMTAKVFAAVLSILFYLSCLISDISIGKDAGLELLNVVVWIVVWRLTLIAKRETS